MGAGDKIRNKADELAGKVKEGVGKATDNERLEAEGTAQQLGADAKQVREKAKDAVKDLTD